MKKLLPLLLTFTLGIAESLHYLPELARQSIENALAGTAPDKEAWLSRYPSLNDRGAVFVTLSKAGKLRGCIGSLQARRPLFDDVSANAASAAFKDPRFTPLRPEELAAVEVEVSLLHPSEAVEYEDVADLKRQIAVGQDGVILTLGNHRSTYLPQVWESLPTFDSFFAHLCEKAGLDATCLEQHPQIRRYRVEKIKERSIRKMARQGTFYPAECTAMTSTLQHLESSAFPRTVAGDPRAVIVPHAGYVFSGRTAMQTYAAIAGKRFKRIVVLGPSHHVRFEGISGSFVDALETPCGLIPVDHPYLKRLSRLFSIGYAREAHALEHSTEVQFPMLRHFWPGTPVIELIYSEVSRQTLGMLMIHLLRDPQTLLVVSSDLSHYHPLEEAKKRDHACIGGILQDRKQFEHCEACGKPGIVALTRATTFKGWHRLLIDYRTSADAFGDTDRVVGYIGVVFSKGDLPF